MASRSDSRLKAFQVLYGQSFAKAATLDELYAAFQSVPEDDGEDDAAEGADRAAPPPGGRKRGSSGSRYAWQLVEGVWSHWDELDETVKSHARNWRLDRMGRVELTVLRLALHEMRDREDIPTRVAIDEALNLLARFAMDDARPFVNGILHSAATAMGKSDMRAGAGNEAPGKET
ncbi:MAG: transcription antitermination factor NusB [Desulfovibrio sp.]|jgi:N utilization substance protein B|nr:transcription antitermination factor NusB [Desulfovibrio sp.]